MNKMPLATSTLATMSLATMSLATSTRAAWRRLAFVHALIVIGLVVASIATDASILWLRSSISLGQTAVLAVWLTFGCGKASVRFVVYFVLGTLLVVIEMIGVRFNFEAFLIDVFAQVIVPVCVVSFPLLISWGRGWRLVHASVTQQVGEPWQVSTRLLLALTFLIALLLTLHRLAASMGSLNDGGSMGFPNDPNSKFAFIVVFIVMSIVITLGMSLAIMSAVWSCLATRGYLSRFVATSIIVAVLAAIPMHVSLGSVGHLQWAKMISTMMLTVVLSLLFLRRCGVRAVKAYAGPFPATQLVAIHGQQAETP